MPKISQKAIDDLNDRAEAVKKAMNQVSRCTRLRITDIEKALNTMPKIEKLNEDYIMGKFKEDQRGYGLYLTARTAEDVKNAMAAKFSKTNEDSEMKISMNKKYKYGNGRLARILCVDVPHVLTGKPVLSMDEFGTLFSHYANGHSNEVGSSLIEIGKYDHIKIGDPCIGMDGNFSDKNWVVSKGYFSGVNSSGLPTMFDDGATAWSSEGEVTSWESCELAE